MLSEEQLIKNCQQGIKTSQYELVKRYSGMLMSVCRRYVVDDHSAKDILQETLIRIFTHIHKYKAIGSFEAWMRKIAIRCALSWLDKSCFQKEVELTSAHDKEVTNPKVYDEMGIEKIQQFIKELPIGFRTVFNLYVIEGYSHKEISELLQITESASRSQLARGRKILQKKLNSFNTPNYKSA